MKIFEAVKSALLKGLPDLVKRDLYYRVYDVHYYLYRRADHFVIWSDAKKALIELDVWHCIDLIQDHRDSPYVNLADPCQMANMMVYIIGGELLQKIYGDRSRRLSPDELIVFAHRWFEKNPDGLEDIWENTILGLPDEALEAR